MSRKAKVFQPFQRVWTPRTPDSGYDSLGAPAPPPIVNAPLISEGIGSGVILQLGLYQTPLVARASSETAGAGIKLQGGTYTKAP
jgi:hypothetical protein